MPLTRGHEALIDPCDVERVSKVAWSLSLPAGSPFVIAQATIDSVPTEMTRFIARAPDEFNVITLNGNRLDCRRGNLAFATDAEKACWSQGRRESSSPYKGVSRLPDGNFRAAITFAGRRTRIGHYTTEYAAAEAYDNAAREQHGRFARLNFRRVDDVLPLTIDERGAT